MNIIFTSSPDFLEIKWNDIPNRIDVVNINKQYVQELYIEGNYLNIVTSNNHFSFKYQEVDEIDGAIPVSNQDMYEKINLIL